MIKPTIWGETVEMQQEDTADVANLRCPKCSCKHETVSLRPLVPKEDLPLIMTVCAQCPSCKRVYVL